MTGIRFRAACVKAALLSAPITLVLASAAQAQAPVPLGAGDPFVVLAGTAVNNSGPTLVTGDLGVSPGGSVTGFPPGTVNGTIHAGDATAGQAQADLMTAYLNAAGQTPTSTIATELGGQVLTPGVYNSASGTFQLNGALTLDGQGDPDAIFIFQTTGSLTTGAGSQVNLSARAQQCNVFWPVGSTAALGASSLFRGNILAVTSITADTGATGFARVLARNGAVTLNTNTVTRAQCDQKGPRVEVTGLPKRCASGKIKVKVRVRDPLGIERTEVFLDGRRLARSRKQRLTVRINAGALAPGRHTLKVVARDTAGNKTVKKDAFNRCAGAGAGAPRFTG